MMPKKLLYIFDETDWHSRIPLARAAQKKGLEVSIGLLSDNNDPPQNDEFKLIAIPRSQGGFGPFAVLGTIQSLRKIVAQESPDIVHTVTLKYAFLLGLALLFSKPVKVFYTLAGLGYVFRGEGLKPKIMRLTLSLPLKIVLKNPRAKLIFQNPDDQTLLIDTHYANENQTHLVRGTGVDLEKFKSQDLPDEKPALILMPTRLVHGKGVGVFIEAAHILKQKGFDARFEIAGGETRHNPEAITADEMHTMIDKAEGAATWLGRVEDMPGLLAQASLIVYPSYYGEGIPRVLLEAAAVGRPLITADSPGCREAVQDGKNGFLVPIKDAQATAEAIEKVFADHAQMIAMGKASRAMAEAEFNVHDVAQRTLKLYEA